MGAIKFGTDGWRAVIAEDFTFANLDRVSQATADYWKANPVAGADSSKVVVGYDRRFLSDQFAARVAEVLAANGFTVGAHTLTAVATNGDGTITATSPATVINIAAPVGTAPTITLGTSASGGLVPVNQNTTLSATAADADGFIPSTAGGGVTFFVDGDPVVPAGSGAPLPCGQWCGKPS
jgi:hypothetical protein